MALSIVNAPYATPALTYSFQSPMPLVCVSLQAPHRHPDYILVVPFCLLWHHHGYGEIEGLDSCLFTGFGPAISTTTGSISMLHLIAMPVFTFTTEPPRYPSLFILIAMPVFTFTTELPRYLSLFILIAMSVFTFTTELPSYFSLFILIAMPIFTFTTELPQSLHSALS